MALPDCLVIGPMKAGTTWLASYLEERGDICLPAGVKETFFFDRQYDAGLDWYRAHFDHHDPNQHRRIVEVAPSYFHSADAPERVREDLGPIRLVAILRDPVRRAWSHYCHLLRYGYTRLPLRQAAAQFPAILDASRYDQRLQAWARYFPVDDIRLLCFESLATDEAVFCAAACDALDITYLEPAPDGERETYAAAQPTSLWLARISRNVSALLKRHRLYSVVDFGKKLGLGNLAFGRSGGAPMPKPDDADLEWLARELGPDIIRLRSRVDVAGYPWLTAYQ